MTIKIGDVRKALADTVTQGTQLRCSPYELSQVSPPCAMVSRRAMDPRMVLSGASNVYQFQITVWMAGQSEVAAQRKIDELCETSGFGSMKEAVETSSRWNIDIDYAQITRIGDTEERASPDGGVYWTVTFDVEAVW